MKKKQEVKQWKKREPEATYDTRHRREELLNSTLHLGLSPTQDSPVFNVKFIIVSVILETRQNQLLPPDHTLLLPSALIEGWQGPLRGDSRRLPAWRQPAAEVPLVSVDVNFHCPMQGPLR